MFELTNSQQKGHNTSGDKEDNQIGAPAGKKREIKKNDHKSYTVSKNGKSS